MEFLFLDQQTMDELYPSSSDFYEALARPWTPVEKAALIWRMDDPSRLVIEERKNADDQH